MAGNPDDLHQEPAGVVEERRQAAKPACEQQACQVANQDQRAERNGHLRQHQAAGSGRSCRKANAAWRAGLVDQEVMGMEEVILAGESCWHCLKKRFERVDFVKVRVVVGDSFSIPVRLEACWDV
jgi:hypothetical protein